jgi:hypothetical protein
MTGVLVKVIELPKPELHLFWYKWFWKYLPSMLIIITGNKTLFLKPCKYTKNIEFIQFCNRYWKDFKSIKIISRWRIGVAINNKSHIMVANYFDMAFFETVTSWSNWHFCQISRLEFSSRIVLFNSRFTISTKPLITFNMHWPATRVFRLIVFLDVSFFTLRFHVMHFPKHCLLSQCSLSIPFPSVAFHFTSFDLLA